MGSLSEKNLKITFLTDAPFIVKFRFEKYRYLLTACCASKYSKLLSLKAIQLVPKKRTRQEPKGGRLVHLPVLSDDTVILSPNI